MSGIFNSLIEEELSGSYLSYSMSVIVSRAIPDLRDGFKPVHRRIIYSMFESGCFSTASYRKSAKIVGDVMGKYHPHGDSAIYDSMVRMAQDFSQRAVLIDGQGNFGSMDGDSAAAMRYTESRMAKISEFIIKDIEEGTVDFVPNYDASSQEPIVLPSYFPNILVNGGSGVAVGMATNVPTHNLGEVMDACCLCLDRGSDFSFDDIFSSINGPDFPTGGMIMGKQTFGDFVITGRGSFVVRSKTHFEDIGGNRSAIVITEIPYQVNKARMIESIATLVNSKKIEGISDIRDESDRDGVRVVIELKRAVSPEIILNKLFMSSPMQVTFSANMVLLAEGVPRLVNVKEVIEHFVDFRKVVVIKRTNFRLDKAKHRAHSVIGLLIAVLQIDQVIENIRASKDSKEALDKLMSIEFSLTENLIAYVDDLEESAANKQLEGLKQGLYYLSEQQSKSILDMKLQRLTGLEKDKLRVELEGLIKDIRYYNSIINSEDVLNNLLKSEFLEIKEKFDSPRRTQIIEKEVSYSEYDLIDKEDVVVIVTVGGYIKRVPLSSYKEQKRGGKGRIGQNLKDEDIIRSVFVASTHDSLLFFSNRGIVYRDVVYNIPTGDHSSRGRSLNNFLNLMDGERVNSVLPIDVGLSYDDFSILFTTKNGTIRRNELGDFSYIPRNGKIAIKLSEDNSLVGVVLCRNDSHVLLSSKCGKSIRFPVEKLRLFKSRASEGVRGIKIADGDEVVSVIILNSGELSSDVKDVYMKIPTSKRLSLKEKVSKEDFQVDMFDGSGFEIPAGDLLKFVGEEQYILSITENGYGKRTSSYEYRVTNRGGSGIINIVTSKRNGSVVDSFPVEADDHIIIMTDKGRVLRTSCSSVRITGRNTQGVTLFKVNKGEKVVSVARVPGDDDEIEVDNEENNEENSDTPVKE